MTGLTVSKFGGSSLADAQRIRNVGALVRQHANPGVAVVSAMGGITDLLVAALAHAADGVIDQQGLATITERHSTAAAELGVDPNTTIEPLLTELAELLRAAATVRGAPPRIRDRVLATGEKLSARLLAAWMNTQAGGPARAVDADTFLETDARHGEASPVPGVYPGSARAVLGPLLDKGITPIVTGFCGRSPSGATTTLGRGGSDYSATLVAAALGADKVLIWTDVAGVYSAHPGIVPDARVVDQLNYREAGELAFYGAKVLHPRTIQPLIGPGIPAVIKSTFDPAAPGTRIDNTVTGGSHPVKAVSAVHGQALLSIEGTGMAGVPGTARRIFATLAEVGISVTVISQSSAESSVCIAVPADRAAEAQVALRDEFRLDLGRGDVEDVRLQTDVALVAVVGLGMNHAVGIAGRVFAAAAAAGINILAIAQGSSELNITFAVHESESAHAVRAVHESFGLHLLDTGQHPGRHADVLLLGAGAVGRAVARLIDEQAGTVRTRSGLTPRIVGIADRRGYLFEPSGLSGAALGAVLAAKEQGRPLSDVEGGSACTDPGGLLDRAIGYRLSHPLLVDATDGDTRGVHTKALLAGLDIVTANKGPVAGTASQHAGLAEALGRSGGLLRHEATVGAGLPVIDTIEQLVASGDRIRRIEGCLSGTLTYLLTRMGSGDGLSEVLTDAARNGYIEPNPLIDLSGEDVRRKAVILARAAGFDIADDRVVCEGLVDRDAVDPAAPAPDHDRVLELCADLPGRVAEAAQSGQALRYVAVIEPQGITVGPRAVEPSSPIGTLTGTDNLVLIRSERYRDRPLVISGPGAGVDVTAMGVFTDILRVLTARTAHRAEPS